MELNITWNRVVRVWWALVWRSLICGVVGMIAGFIIGFIVGFVLGFIGIETEIAKKLTYTTAFVIGLAFSIFPIKLIIGKNFGEFRLVLLSNPTAIIAPTST